jgi:ABC-type polysaccharide/polyol phosphate export permease
MLLAMTDHAVELKASPAGQIARGLLRRWASVQVWLELLGNLAFRDIETRYKHSMLGLYWAVINPLLTALILAFVFVDLFHASSQPIPHVSYIVFLVANLTFWNYFANSLNSATGSVTGSAALLSKLYFPRLVVPAAAVCARVIDLLFSSLVLGIFIVLFRAPLHLTAFWIIPLLALQTVFALGCAFAFAALNVLLRDMSQIVGLLLMVWMYVSPVMYPLAGQTHALQALLLINPMGALLQAEQDVLFVGHLTHPAPLWSMAAWAGFSFAGGTLLFKRTEPLFAEVM